MIVNFEFLDKEPLDNVISCMKYKFDKVIFFGYHSDIEKMKKQITNFLKKYCGVSSVKFVEFKENDLVRTMEVMRKEIEAERLNKSDIYFDLTGGEDIILVAFGRLSGEYKLPEHKYDIKRDKLIELDPDLPKRISQDVPQNDVVLDISKYIELSGGIVNMKLHKEIKNVEDQEFARNVDGMWQVMKHNWKAWNLFSGFLRSNIEADPNLNVRLDGTTIETALGKIKSKNEFDINKLNKILDELEQNGIIKDLVHKPIVRGSNGLIIEPGEYSFKIKNQMIKECLWDGGSVLELHTYMTLMNQADDCRVGVHLDWDGVILNGEGIDVYNEVDVITLDKNIITSISCKSGKLDKSQGLHALYELDAIDRKFGGKYSRKKLVLMEDLPAVYAQRAKEMNIEVENIRKEET